MTWALLKNAHCLQMLEKLSILQVKMTELVAKQKYNNMRVKLNMLRSEEKKDGDRGSTGN